MGEDQRRQEGQCSSAISDFRNEPNAGPHTLASSSHLGLEIMDVFWIFISKVTLKFGK